MTKNALTAILSYELSRLDNLSTADQLLAAAELSAAIQTMKIASRTDGDFFKNQANYYTSLKREALSSGVTDTRQVKFIVAGTMECICKADAIDGLQDDLLVSVKTWIRSSADKI